MPETESNSTGGLAPKGFNMMCLNRVCMIGRAGDSPVVKQAGASQVAEVNIALSEKYRDAKKEMQERTEWVRFVAWGKLAEIAEKYIHKGSLVYAEGKLQTSKWTAKDGSQHSRTEVYGTNLIVLDGRNFSQKENAPHEDYSPIPPKMDAKFAYEAPEDESLPF